MRIAHICPNSYECQDPYYDHAQSDEEEHYVLKTCLRSPVPFPWELRDIHI